MMNSIFDFLPGKTKGDTRRTCPGKDAMGDQILDIRIDSLIANLSRGRDPFHLDTGQRTRAVSVG